METFSAGVQTLMINLIVAGLIFYIGKGLAKYVADFLGKVMARRDTDPALVSFTRSLVHWGLLAFVVVAALSQLGIQTTSFIAILGAAGLAVGLALQGSLANFAAGVLILAFKPFRIGDFVEIGGAFGAVTSIQIFTTEILTGDNRQIIMPNSAITNGAIINYSAMPTRRIDLVFGIGYGDDIDKARKVIVEVLAADERILKDPAPTVVVAALADSSVNFNVRPWVKSADYWPVHAAVTEQVKKRFDAEAISIPFPQRDVHLYQK